MPLMNILKKKYEKEGGWLPAAGTWLDWHEKYDAEELCKKITVFFTKDTKVGNTQYKKRHLVPSFTALTDDGTTMSLNWLYAGSFTE
ncbi:hypothetical protein [Oceanidesulfovibrio marinus]|uniref:hypothetical protein n=1 Tax=Oceanidesulfovibrio marinus TaxID=370038 RepID=UPI00118612F7|nr:hypothetical protein [Oceanidesulfovibrio marinus]